MKVWYQKKAKKSFTPPPPDPKTVPTALRLKVFNVHWDKRDGTKGVFKQPV